MTENKESKNKDTIEIPIGKYISSVKKFGSSLKTNVWMTATIALAIIVVLLLIFGTGAGAVSKDAAGKNLINFVNGLGQGTGEIVSVVKEGALYKATVKFNGQDIPVYVTLDGKYMIQQPVPLTSDTPQQPQQKPAANVTKSDKPKVELFVMSYCPYGTQMEKGILPVLATLGNKIDFTLRYTHFTLHGEKEDTENFRQLCIREEQPTKFLSYIQCTLNSTSSSAPADVTKCMSSLGIDQNKVKTCMAGKAKDYYKVDSDLSQGYGVKGSPTLVINGVTVDSARSPAAILKTICSAFNNAPSECNTQLASDSPSPGFGYSSSGADSAAASCGV